MVPEFFNDSVLSVCIIDMVDSFAASFRGNNSVIVYVLSF